MVKLTDFKPLQQELNFYKAECRRMQRYIMDMEKPTKPNIERFAAEIIKYATPHGYGSWSQEFISKAVWPKSFYSGEREFARHIAKKLLTALYRNKK